MTKREKWIVFPCCLVLLGIFTFMDLPISMALYSKNLFGKLFEIIGELPAMLLVILGSSLLFRFRNKKNKTISISTGIVWGYLVVSFAFMSGFMMLNYINKNFNLTIPYLASGIIALFFIVLIYGLAKKVPEKNKAEAIAFAKTALIYFVSILVVMNVLKFCWGRMRFNEMTDIASQFSAWYQIQFRGAFSNVYASFPSGHTMNATAIILITLLPRFIPALQGKQKPLKIITYVWIITVACSRIVMGAHFASDVTVGAMLSLALFEIIYTLIYRKRNQNIAQKDAERI